jgi:hypothetical protein
MRLPAWVEVGLILVGMVTASAVGLRLASASSADDSLVLRIGSGVFTGLGVALAIARLQSPRFRVEVTHPEDVPWEDREWRHVSVANDAIGMFGAGSAVDCEGVVTASRTVPNDTRSIFGKWANNLLPGEASKWTYKSIDYPHETTSSDVMIAHNSRLTTIHPRQDRKLDITFRHLDTESAYWGDYRTYLGDNLEDQRFAISDGTYEIQLRVVYRGRPATWVSFVLVKQGQRLELTKRTK